MNQDIEAYLKQIERNLFTCSRKKRSAFLRDFRGGIDSYLAEHPQATAQELRMVFGTPEAIAESFMQSDGVNVTKKVVSSKRTIFRVVLIAVCALVAAAVIFGTLYIIDYHRFTHGYWVEEPAVIGEIPPDPDALETY